MAISAPVTGLRQTFREVVRTKAGIAGLGMLAVLVGMIVVIPFVAPFDLVREWGSRNIWLDNPRDAAPEWTELFAGKKLLRSIILNPCFPSDSIPQSTATAREACPGGSWTRTAVRVIQTGDFTFVKMQYAFDYQADVFPSEMSMSVWADYGPNAPLVVVTWVRPDGVPKEILRDAPDQPAPAANFYAISTSPVIKEDIRSWAISYFNATDVSHVRPEVTLFAVAGPTMLDITKATVLKGKYTLTIDFQASGTVGADAKAIIFGTVFGVAGTDSSRRDLLLGFLWGAPIALMFGVIAAVVIVLLQSVLGALAAWYGGWWDEGVQRGADILLILPILPILLLMGIVYGLSIWAVLLVLILFGFLGSTTKVARSIVLQVKEEGYVEAAVSYGASRSRILFRHIMPRLMPYTFALIALSVPAFIFLEASLSFLGLGDPLVPTWGAILGQAYNGNAVFRGFWWWIAYPAGGIIFATVAFALLGYSFDKVLNPRLREQ